MKSGATARKIFSDGKRAMTATKKNDGTDIDVRVIRSIVKSGDFDTSVVGYVR